MTRLRNQPAWAALLIVIGLLSPSAAQKELLYDFETPEQHRENTPGTSVPPGWGSFGTITTDRGPTTDASAGETARFHSGDFDLPSDLPGNYGLVDVSDRFVPYRKDFSNYVGLSLDLKFKVFEALPYEGPIAIEVGIGFIVPGVGEDESLAVYSEPITLTESYDTYDVFFSDYTFVQSGAALENDLANNAFIKLRFSNTMENYGRGAFYYDEIYGILGSGPAGDADFDSDGDVDGNDFLVWQQGFGLASQTNKSAGDSNGDGVVDGADLGVWSGQFGSVGSTALGVPEPGALLLSGVALIAAAGRRKTQRR
ncbi:hypothetical protein Pla108_40770 [Botrimarina colliarenosi]|uniref:Ice-binding protein C-terminal domain-containing protein n=1 Tax=Botrimarina colliarenosi TaxID=2528001 RepID=A0A5C5ZXS3_9BACT|nr:PEP-CTERM sorting domain-containing protein [Botrimarina colliarenosi]TWT92452.1 hypothetical protein Pla108_40770 [Botrimarina colliarenosi]